MDIKQLLQGRKNEPRVIYDFPEMVELWRHTWTYEKVHGSNPSVTQEYKLAFFSFMAQIKLFPVQMWTNFCRKMKESVHFLPYTESFQ